MNYVEKLKKRFPPTLSIRLVKGGRIEFRPKELSQFSNKERTTIETFFGVVPASMFFSVKVDTVKAMFDLEQDEVEG